MTNKSDYIKASKFLKGLNGLKGFTIYNIEIYNNEVVFSACNLLDRDEPCFYGVYDDINGLDLEYAGLYDEVGGF